MTASTPALLTQERLDESARACALLCDYAYEMGFHEMGYAPLDDLLQHIAALTQRVEAMGHWGDQLACWHDNDDDIETNHPLQQIIANYRAAREPR